MRLLKIGRDSSCDIVLTSNCVSALHAELTILNDGQIIIEDKGSTNGTSINGHKLTPHSPHAVQRGDRVQLGDMSLPWGKVPVENDYSEYKKVISIGYDGRNTIQVANKNVSRYHATFLVSKRNKCYVIDHSKNGTTVNGRSIPKNVLTAVNPRKDKIAVGQAPVSLSAYVPRSFNWTKAAVVAACVLILAGVGVLAWNKVFSSRVKGFSQVNDYIPATSLVVGEYYYVVSFRNDPMLAACEKYGLKVDDELAWPESFIIGEDDHHNLCLKAVEPAIDGWAETANTEYASLFSVKPQKVHPISWEGTAFFVSNDGRLVTNKHVAYPWLFRSAKQNRQLTALMGEIREKLMPINPMRSYNISDLNNFMSQEGLFKGIFLSILNKDDDAADYINSCISGFQKCDLNIDGEIQDLRIAQANHNYNSTDEFLPVSVTDTLDNPEVDLAMLQLNNKMTPQEVKIVIDPDKSITDPKSIKPMADTYYYLGYPFGSFLNLNNKTGGLFPRLNDLKIARAADNVNVEFQAQAFPGASGSPVVDKAGHLVAVVSMGGTTAEISGGVLAKYVVELYHKAIGK